MCLAYPIVSIDIHLKSQQGNEHAGIVSSGANRGAKQIINRLYAFVRVD